MTSVKETRIGDIVHLSIPQEAGYVKVEAEVVDKDALGYFLVVPLRPRSWMALGLRGCKRLAVLPEWITSNVTLGIHE